VIPELPDHGVLALFEYGTEAVVPGSASIATGDSDRTKSAWFVSYTTDLSTAVTLFRNKPGQPQRLPLQGVGGNNSARGNVFPPRIWARFMGGAGNFSLNRAKHVLPSQLPRTGRSERTVGGGADRR
jgi:membrane peptidoglycan carboxypeptidase